MDNVIYKPLCGKCYLKEIDKYSNKIEEEKTKEKVMKKHDE